MLFAKIAVVDNVRSAERRALAQQTTIRLDKTPTNVGVYNLSATGCLLRTSDSIKPGLEVRIGLPGVGAFRADVVRAEGHDVGCRFHVPLTPQQLSAAFQSDVVFDGNWRPEPTPLDSDRPQDELSGRAKLVCVVGLSGLLWGLIAAGFRFIL